MIYKRFQDLELSYLGLGCMRLPTIGTGRDAPIDEAGAIELIRRAYESGVNYFDTAFRYHGGESERVVGKALRDFPRDTWHLATKMPGHMMEYVDGKCRFTSLLTGKPGLMPSELFERQLETCGVDYFDFYLLHNLCETAYPFYTDETLKVVDMLLSEKKQGRIRHLGFSAHGRADTIDRFLSEHPGAFEFAQIQLNYLDWTLQDAKSKYDVLSRHGLPVIVMEPVRGGRLSDLGPAGNALLKDARPDDSIASWAFRFLQSLPNVLLALSGMSTIEQLDENVRTCSRLDPVGEADIALLNRAIAGLIDMVPCTACRYCTEGCPAGLDIPKLLSMFNESRMDTVFSTLGFTIKAMKKEELPGACLDCAACTRACPQGIDIPGALKAFAPVADKLAK